MAVIKRKGRFYIYFRPFKDKKIGLRLDVENKVEATQIESLLTRACRTGNYGLLDSVATEACRRMFQHQGWQLPEALGEGPPAPVEELTLWKASELFLRYPEIKAKGSRALVRYGQAIVNLARLLGKDNPLKALWVPSLKRYQLERTNEGAAPNTVNIELSTLSRIFRVMIEMQLLETNPTRLVKRLSTKANVREVYLSPKTAEAIAADCPEWFQRILWCAYYSGMRKGEILGLRRRQVDLSSRIITLGAQDVKERAPKRVPIHLELVPILEEAMRTPSLLSDAVFLVQDRAGTRPPGTDTLSNCWPRACAKLGLKEPWPRFHDLRGSWKSCARRSGMDPEIRESIMGHWFKEKSVSERYGRISNQELVQAIDCMTFDHGDTEILVPHHEKRASKKKGNKLVTNPSRGPKRAVGA